MGFNSGFKGLNTYYDFILHRKKVVNSTYILKILFVHLISTVNSASGMVCFQETAVSEEEPSMVYKVNRQEAAARGNMENIQRDKNRITLLGTHK